MTGNQLKAENKRNLENYVERRSAARLAEPIMTLFVIEFYPLPTLPFQIIFGRKQLYKSALGTLF